MTAHSSSDTFDGEVFLTTATEVKPTKATNGREVKLTM